MEATSKFFKKILTLLIVLLMGVMPLIVNATDVIIEEPTPDTKPPELNGLTISSNEATPQQSVKLTAEVSDDLSGIKTVSGSYRSPNNGSKYITFYLNQTTNKYEATIQFSQYDDPGEWSLYSINLNDKKDNYITIYNITNTNSNLQKYDFSNYFINVSGVIPKPPKEDITPPVLKDIETTNNVILNANENVKIVADVTDDLSGVSSVYANYQKPSGRSQNVYLYYNQASQKYEGNLTIDTYEELGTWKLRYVYVSDKESNSKTIYDSNLYASSSSEKRDFSNCNVEVSGTTPDLIAPNLKNLTIGVEQLSKTEAIVKYTAEVTDNLSGVNSVYASFTKPSGRSFTIYFSKQQNEYVGIVKIDKYDELDTWKIRQIHLSDNKGNSRIVREVNLGSNDGYWELSKYYFHVRGLITIDPATPSSLEVLPKELVLEPGESYQLETILKMTDGTSTDATLSNSGTIYTTTNPEAVIVDENGFITVSSDAKAGIVYVQAQNGKIEDSIRIVIPGDSEEPSLSIKPFSLTLAPGQSKQLYVEAKLEDGVTKEITSVSSGVKYSSDNQSVNVSESGFVSISPTAVPENATITINYEGMVGKVNVAVTGPPTVKSLAMTPAVGTVPAGETIQLRVRATMSDGSTKDVTNIVEGTTFITSDKSKVVVSESGLVTVPASALNGDVYITAKNNGVSTKSKIIVSSPILKNLEVTPNTQTLYREESISLVVRGTYSDGEIKDLTLGKSGTTYTSSVPSRVMIDEDGNITVPNNATYGDAVITIKNGLVKSIITIEVKENPSEVLTEIMTESDFYSAIREETIQLEVTGLFADGLEKNLTSSDMGTTYISSVPSRAIVDENGLISVPSSATYGDVTITIKNGSLRKTVLVTIEEILKNELVVLNIDTDSIPVYREEELQLKINGIYSDGTVTDITNSSEGTTYVSSVPSRAVVDENGKITIPSSASYGAATITVKNGSQRAYFVLTVEEDLTNVLTGMEVMAEKQAGYRGEEIQLTVIGTLGGGKEKDITLGTEGTTYTSSVPSRAVVDENGKITIPSSASYGAATITVKNGSQRAYFVLTVMEDETNVVTGMEVIAEKQTGYRGEEIQLSVIGTLGGGNEKDLTLGTEGTTYTSSVPSRAVVDENGKITIPSSASYGTATIIVKNGSQRAYFMLTIEEDVTNVVTGIEVTAEKQTGYRGEEIQLNVIGTLGGGKEKDLTLATEGTTYTSSVPSRAVVDVNGKITIPMSATYGNVTITIKNGTLKKYYILTVSQDVSKELKELKVQPTSTTVYKGSTKELTIIGVYGNGDLKNLTTSSEGTTYTSSVPSRALINENGIITIPSSASSGNVTITIKNGQVRTTLVLTVK